MSSIKACLFLNAQHLPQAFLSLPHSIWRKVRLYDRSICYTQAHVQLGSTVHMQKLRSDPNLSALFGTRAIPFQVHVA